MNDSEQLEILEKILDNKKWVKKSYDEYQTKISNHNIRVYKINNSYCLEIYNKRSIIGSFWDSDKWGYVFDIFEKVRKKTKSFKARKKEVEIGPDPEWEDLPRCEKELNDFLKK